MVAALPTSAARLNPRTHTVGKATARWVLAAILLLAFGVRVIKPDFLSLNSDESYFVQIAYLGTYLRDMAATEPHPPLYLAMLQGWMQASGLTEYAIRYLSIIVGVATVGLTYRFGVVLGGRALGLATAFAAALNPYQILYSQTARNYELTCGLALLSFLLFLKAWERPRLIPAYVAATLAAIFAHYYALAIVGMEQLVLAIWLLQRREARLFRHWIIADAAIAVVFLPWLAYASTALVNYDLGHGTLTTLFGHLRTSFDLYHFGAAFDPAAVGPLTIAAVALGVLGLVGLGLMSKRSLGWAVGYQIAPIAFGIATWIHTFQFGPRFVFIGSPGYAAIVGGAILLFARIPWGSVVPAGFIAYLTGLSIYNSVLTDRFKHDDYGTMAAYLTAHAQPGETVVLDGISQWLQFWYYAQLRNGLTLPVEFMPRDATGGGADGTAVDVEQTRRRLQDIARRSQGIWFVDTDSARYDPHHDAERVLTGGWSIGVAKDFVGERLKYYTMAPATAAAVSTGSFGTLRLDSARVGATVSAGRTLPVELHWSGTAPTAAAKESLRLLDGAGTVVAQRDADLLGGFSDSWTGGQAEDRPGTVVPVGTLPGTYSAQLVVYNAASGRSLGDPLRLGQVQVDHAAPQSLTAADLPALNIQAGALRLSGGVLTTAPVEAGSRLPMTLLWTGGPTPTPQQVEVRIGTRSFQRTIGGDAYPSTRWQPNDVVRDAFTIRLPGDLPPGAYPVTAAGASLGTVQVTAGQHNFAAPTPSQPLAARFGDVAGLVGYSAEPGPQGLHIRLFWQALTETDTSYTVFLHATAPDGKIVAQSDVAAGTDRWLKGEYLTTDYDLAIPAGTDRYTVSLGMYDGHTGTRLQASTGGDEVRLLTRP